MGKSYGILGWITIFSFTEIKENIFFYAPWFFRKEKQWLKIQLENWKKHNKIFIVLIKNISDRSTASKLTNSDIIISKNTLPVLKKDEYYWNDIINYKVFNINKDYLGQVISLIRTKCNDILVIHKKLEISKTQILIPFIKNKIIKNIDNSQKVIIVKWN